MSRFFNVQHGMLGRLFFILSATDLSLATFQKAIKSGVAPVPFDEVREISRWAIRLQSMKHAGEKLIL